MRKLRNLPFVRSLGRFAILSVLATACVNHLPTEEIVDDGNIPLRITARIHEATRVAANSFQAGDKVGLFALAGSTGLQEDRYVDNLHFVQDAGGNFVSDELVYYPGEGITLKLISYYPYQQGGIAIGKTTLPVSVVADQSVSANLSASYFLVATADDVSANTEAVPLTYHHQFSRLKIAIKPNTTADLEALRTANPKLLAKGFYTKAVYDFQTKSFSDYSEEKDITPAGAWTVNNDQLTGQEFILIPQGTTSDYQHIALEIGGKKYTVMLPSSLSLQSGKQRQLDIEFVAKNDVLLSDVAGGIEEWIGTETDRANSELLHPYINVSELTFEPSNVYKIMSNGKQVAEICKEYLVADGISAQAIVAYPMTADGSAVDLSKGTVVQLTGKTGTVHGGKVSWTTNDNTLTYTPGTLFARNHVYVKEDGSISLSIKASDNMQNVLAIGDVVRDVRGGTIQHYPLVKIGTQYWMKENFKGSLYTDGSAIPRLNPEIEPGTDETIGYMLPNGQDAYFYSYALMSSDKLLPVGLSLPKMSDWEILKTYLKNDASVLKAGTWKTVSGKEIKAASNLTGFNAIPIGISSTEHSQHSHIGVGVGYWTAADVAETKLHEKTLLLINESDEFIEASSFFSATNGSQKGKATKAFAIRCLRK